MNLLTRLSIRETSTLSNPSEWLTSMFSAKSKSGINVTPKIALQHTVVYTCVNLLAESMASIPLSVYKREKKSGKIYKKKDYEHPLYILLDDEPNDDMTSFSHRFAGMVDVLLRGNHYTQIIRNNAGKVIGLYPLYADKMRVVRLDSGKIGYIYRHDTLGEVALDASEVLHDIGFTLDGIIGISAIEYNRHAIGASIAMEEHGSTLFKNGANPSGVVSSPTVSSMTDEAFNRFKKSFEERYQGIANSGKPLILEDKFTYTPLTISNKDGQYLESRKFTKAEIAAIFRVPLHKINELDKATFSNIEHQSMEFVTDAIRPWAVRMEKERKRKLFSQSEKKTHYVKFNLGALLRGDTKSRYEAYESAITKGCWMSRNEARELEDMNPRDGLDEMIVPLNFGKEGDSDKKEEN